MKKQIIELIEVQQSVDEKDAYNAGLACATKGSNTENCHWKYFSRPSMTQAWERGKQEGDKTKQ